jgi:hypothetical protein
LKGEIRKIEALKGGIMVFPSEFYLFKLWGIELAPVISLQCQGVVSAKKGPAIAGPKCESGANRIAKMHGWFTFMMVVGAIAGVNERLS